MSRIVLNFYNTAKACFVINAYTYMFIIASLAAPYTASANAESKNTQSNNSKSARINENGTNKTDNCNTNDAICSLLKDIQNNLDNCDGSDTKKIEKIVKKISKTLGDCDDTSVCSELLIIDSRIDTLMGGCSLMPVPDDGIIDVPGSYCLNSIFDNTITISANNVTLDLNGYTIAPTSTVNNGITVESDFSNFHIKNGFIVGGLSGIFINDSCNEFIISDIEISQSAGNGIAMLSTNTTTGIKNFTIKNCTSINAAFTSFEITSCSNFVIDNCIAENSTFGSGFDFSFSANSLIRNCIAQNNTAGFLALNAFNFTLDNCIAQNNNGFGFSSSPAFNGLIHDCIAQNNTDTGFFLSQGSNTSINNCTSQNNTNVASGFDLSAASSCKVMNCSALSNAFIGFNDSNPSNNFYANNLAVDNVNSNYALGISPVIAAASQSAAGFWDNLGSPTAP